MAGSPITHPNAPPLEKADIIPQKGPAALDSPVSK